MSLSRAAGGFSLCQSASWLFRYYGIATLIALCCFAVRHIDHVADSGGLLFLTAERDQSHALPLYGVLQPQDGRFEASEQVRKSTCMLGNVVNIQGGTLGETVAVYWESCHAHMVSSATLMLPDMDEVLVV